MRPTTHHRPAVVVTGQDVGSRAASDWIRPGLCDPILLRYSTGPVWQAQRPKDGKVVGSLSAVGHPVSSPSSSAPLVFSLLLSLAGAATGRIQDGTVRIAGSCPNADGQG